jgi:sugar/nucleoside kinase (ribokinase family)
MFDIIAFGGLIVEFVRPAPDMPLDKIYPIIGPYPSGASAITISTAARLGLKTAFVGVCGNDFFGREVVHKRMQNDGVNMEHVALSNKINTGVVFVMYKSDGSRMFNHVTNYSSLVFDDIPELKIQNLPETKWIHINGTILGEKSVWKKYSKDLIDYILGRGSSLSFDINFRPNLMGAEAVNAQCGDFIRGARYFMPSEEEALFYFETDSVAVAIDKSLEMGPEIVCIKQGNRGCTVVSRTEGPYMIPTFDTVKPIDPTGAGDSFNGAFICAREKGLSLEDSAIFANAVGSFAVSKRGPMEGSPTIEELKFFMEQNGVLEIWKRVYEK